MKSNDITGGRYVGRDGSVREVLGRYADKIGVLKVDYVRVPGDSPRTCTLAAFARWAVSHA